MKASDSVTRVLAERTYHVSWFSHAKIRQELENFLLEIVNTL